MVQACRQCGASVAAIALRNGLNANVVHRRLSQDGLTLDGGDGNRAAVTTRLDTEFLPVQLPQPALATTILTPGGGMAVCLHRACNGAVKGTGSGSGGAIGGFARSHRTGVCE